MSGWRLTQRQTPPLPVDMSPLSEAWPTARIGSLPRLRLPMGSATVALGEWFDVAAVAEDGVTLEGDEGWYRLGAGWDRGTLRVLGRGGDCLAAGMRGGEVIVEGNGGDFTAAGMRGGRLTIRGDSGDGLAAPLAGEREGMTEGVIVVTGSVGIRAGENLRRGLIIIGGRAGDFCGAFLRAGTMVVGGRIGRHPGYGMHRGTMLLLDPKARRRLAAPRFRDAGCHDLPFFSILERAILAHEGTAIDPAHLRACRRRFCGDFSIAGKGEVFVPEGR